MIKSALKKSIDQLPVEDRIDLVDDLVVSIAKDQSKIRVPEWQKQMIDERLAEIDANPGRGMPLAEFRRKMRELKKTLGVRPLRKDSH